ncbi:cutinase family protein [Spirillospora sp. NPDC047279]|uniref:cutinase family protein n=1 Tax=Spirillospora sp. NPDC047279 TaxID=3155478 RepID=UPI0033DEC6D2
MTASSATGGDFGGTVKVAAAEDCPAFLVVGARGSGEEKDGPYRVGERLTPYIRDILGRMPGNGHTHQKTLDYPATPTYNVVLWWASVLAGVSSLEQGIYDTVRTCPNTRIGLAGYSQGSLVINYVMQRLEQYTPAVLENNIGAVMLLADPIRASNGGSIFRYGYAVRENGGGGHANGHGMLGNVELPGAIQRKAMDICIVEDPVCNASSSSVLWNAVVALFNSRVHSKGYQVCCGSTSYPERTSEYFANLMMGLVGQGRPAPPEIPAPGPAPVTSVHGLADGTVLITSDTRRVYKMVGGAPIWLTSCENGLCPNPRPTTQAVINAGPAVPRDASTAKDEAGNVFKFVGGAPIHLSSCSVGCGSPVAITAGSIVNNDHMRRVPADGATAKDEAGNVFKFVGGAPIHLTTCNIAGGCGTPVPITAWSIVNYDHMRSMPVDGATAKDEAGNVFRFVGGAPIHLTTCDIAGGCGNPVGISAGSIVKGDHMRHRPSNGATMRDEAGNIFKFAGGAPIRLASCDVGCGKPVSVSAGSIVMLDHMNAVPDDGTTIVTEANQAFVFAGGAPLRLSSCEIGCDTVTRISGASVANLDHMRPVPADNATVRTETGSVYKFAGGAPLWLSNCAPGCGTPVDITQWTIDVREHMHRNPVDGTNLRAVETGTLFRTRGGEADLAGQCPAESGCGGSVTVNQASVDPIAHGVANRGPTYGTLTRYFNGKDHHTTTGRVPAGYRPEWVFGTLAQTAVSGTQALYACRMNDDTFTSVTDTCENQTKIGRLGYIYKTPPQGRPAAAIYRCTVKTAGPNLGEHFESLSETCEGHTKEFRLGYVVAQAELTRYTKGGELRSATASVASGYQPQVTLGTLPQVQMPGTVPLYSCEINGEGFSSKSETCEGQKKLGVLGFIYTAPPQGVPSAQLYRCITAAGTEHFDSLDSACGEHQAEMPLGYVVATTLLHRTMRGSDHRTGNGVFPAGYRHEWTWGYLAATQESGTRPLYSCQIGTDAFTSVESGCEGRQNLGLMGFIWDQPPPGVPSVRIYRCTVEGTVEHFDSTDAGCEGARQEFPLGYVKAVQ